VAIEVLVDLSSANGLAGTVPADTAMGNLAHRP
jgi:hypothetical protein